MPLTEPGPAHPLIEQGALMATPGVHDVLSAVLAERAGFQAAVLTGFGFAAAHLGEPDIGLFTQSEIIDCARRICARTKLSLIVDGDTGHGGPLNVVRLVNGLIQVGAAGVLLEDQTWPKRCGHMRGKSVIDAEEHAAKVRAAVDARADRPFIITARTDALETAGLDEALRRALLYKEAGADVLFVEGPRTREHLRAIGEALPGPLALNLIEGGVTPITALEDAKDLGFFSVGFVLSGLFASAQAMLDVYAAIRTAGGTASLEPRMATFSDFIDLVGLRERLAMDDRFQSGAP